MSIRHALGYRGTATVLQTLVQLNRAVRLTAREADFLRRIAYAELQDGLAERHNASSGGGIWAVDRSLFYRTQSSNVSSLVISKRIKIEERLGIPWGDVQWSDLEDPLHSATAALLVILISPGHSIKGSTSKQALYRTSSPPTNTS